MGYPAGGTLNLRLGFLFPIPWFVDINLVLTFLVAKFIPLPACDKGFFTMPAHAHITVLICEHEGKAHLLCVFMFMY